MDLNKIVKSAIAHCLLLSTMGAVMSSTTVIAANKMEKCYGISKAGMNDCATSTTSCAGSAKRDYQGDAFKFVPAGTCVKVKKGSLTPITAKKQPQSSK